MGSIVNDDAPALSYAAQAASFAWNWLGGWHPERLPIFLAFYPTDDVEGLMDRLLVIRGAIEEKNG